MRGASKSALGHPQNDDVRVFNQVRRRQQDARTASRAARCEVDQLVLKWRNIAMRTPPPGPPRPSWRRESPLRTPERSHGRLDASCGASKSALTRPQHDGSRASNHVAITTRALPNQTREFSNLTWALSNLTRALSPRWWAARDVHARGAADARREARAARPGRPTHHHGEGVSPDVDPGLRPESGRLRSGRPVHADGARTPQRGAVRARGPSNQAGVNGVNRVRCTQETAERRTRTRAHAHAHTYTYPQLVTD